MPPPWRTPAGVRPVVDGTGAVAVDVPQTGRWRVWVGGSVQGRLEVAVDGRAVGHVRHELSYDDQWLRFGTTALDAGRHVVTLRYRRGWFMKAGRYAAEEQPPLGPLALSPAADEGALPLVRVPASQYKRLCDGRSYDWLEGLP
jgi:hypothetical protein